MWLGNDSNHKLKRCDKRHLGGHDKEWCGKCSGNAQCNRCKPEKLDTKELGNILMRIQNLEGTSVPDKREEEWRVEVDEK